MAVVSVDRGASGSANMGKKQFGLDMSSKRAQVTVVPSWQDVFEQARCGAFGVSGHAKTIAIGDPCRLGRSQALAHDGMLLVEDQVFKVNFRTGVSNPSAHH